MNQVGPLVLRDTESQHLVTTIRLSSVKEYLLTWLGELHMNMTNGSLNALIHNSGILMLNTLHRHLLVDHITYKVLRLVLVPSNTLSAMDAPIHLPILHLICLQGRSIPRTNSHHRIQCTSNIQETLLTSTSRVSTILPKPNRSHSWHNLYPHTVHCLRLYHRSQSTPERTQGPWKRTSNQWQVEATNIITTTLNILP